MNAANYAKLQIEESFGLLNTSIGELTDEQYNWKPGGTCNPVAKSHVHVLTSVDFFIGSLLKGGAMLWPPIAEKAGLPGSPLQVWQAGDNIALATINEYGTKVQALALDYVSSLSEADFDREVETPFFGKRNVAYVVQLAGTHMVAHAGDITAVKGMQGLKGLPF